MPDPTSHIRFGSVLQKKDWIILCKTGPDPIWMAWLGIDKTHLVRKQAGVQESSGPVLAKRYQPATSFPLSDSVAVFHRRPGSYIVQNQPGSELVVADCVKVWPNRSDPETTGVQGSSGSLLVISSEPIRIGCESGPACSLGVTVRDSGLWRCVHATYFKG